MLQKKELIFLSPVFKQMIWGGDNLKNQWNYNVPGDNTGECWGISAHEHGDCLVEKGIYKGISLSELWTNHRELFGNVDGDRFPLLTKIIDARTDLSIQVHPDDEYAFNNENGAVGKTECWYVLDAPADGSLVIGHNAKDKDELIDMIKNGKWGSFIRKVPVKKGDFIQIEPGTVHAIKGGIQILETQQNCDITYRVYDYDRLQNGKPRELHVDKSIDVITVPAKSADDSIVNALSVEKNCLFELIACKFYKVWKIEVDSAMNFDQKYPFMCMSVIEGEGTINGENISKGMHFIIPNDFGQVIIEGKLSIIASSI